MNTTRRTDADYRRLFRQYLRHCPGVFSLTGPVCPNCPCLGDCLEESR